LNDKISAQAEDAQPVSLRERKKRLAQMTIEETALRLFQQRGYEQTSIQDIADAVMMSSRTFFRYFASKEEVLFGPVRATLDEGLRELRQVPPAKSPHAAMRATLEHLASLYQEQRASFLTRYRVAMQTPSIASLYLYALMEREPIICDALCSHLETATNHQEIRFLVAIYMTTFRVALVAWFEQDARGDFFPVLREHLNYFSSFAG
jgi:AcrR family transcriptional regulator